MKKFFKILAIFGLIFLVFCYFLGACTADSNNNSSSNSNVEFREVTPEEYEREMQEFIDGQAFDFYNFGLNVYAEDKSNLEIIKDYYKNSEFFDLDNLQVGTKDLRQLFTKDNNAFESVKDDDTGESYVKVPYTYEMYGKNLVVYKGGTWENVEIWISTTSAISDGSKTGTIRIRRTNQNYSYTTFNFDISVSAINRTFGNDKAFLIKFVGINSNVSGCTSDFVDKYLTNVHIVSFALSSVNKIKTYSSSASVALTAEKFIFNTNNADSYTPNGYTLSSFLTNDYEFSQSIDSYVSANKCIKPVNLYYNNNANSVVNNSNVSNYNDYTYNSDTNTIDFDIDSFLNYFDTDLIPKFRSLFDDIFSNFPSLDVDISTEDNITYNNLIDIINQLTTSTTTTVTGTYPIVTTGGGGCDCDINVNVTVDIATVTCEALTTDPFIVGDIDIDNILQADLPERSISSASSLLKLAFGFFDSNSELMAIIFLMAVFVFVSMLFF